ncbi:MAG: aminoglycoside phosphotransferase family protein [Bacteroidales bacterium]|nr:aminoglycoside phosphotransferase family protein [Bacteroidales bacterium]
MFELKKICSRFRITGTFKTAYPYGSGHINDTYKIDTVEEEAHDYILQRVNHQVFKNVPGLMDNIDRVTRHIRSKLEALPDADPDRETLTLVPTHSGETYYLDGSGNYWRVYLFIRDNRSYDIVTSPDQAYQGGRMFGRFQAMLSDLPGDPLIETIPNFHNIEWRLQLFEEALRKDPVQRALTIREEIDFVKKRAEEMSTILLLGREKMIPERITHNDTKFNNVLLDEDDKGLCVIDLDTVMPGYVHYDFGDSIRTTTNTAAEDEKDLDKVEMDIRLFKAYSEGFLEETREMLTTTEIDYLAFAGKLFPYIIGLRFLTDYIEGDHYFKIKHEHHNLQRARSQFKLLRSMERQFQEMRQIIEKLRKRSK